MKKSLAMVTAAILLFSVNTFAGINGAGNGGSGDETQIIVLKNTIDQIIFKIKLFLKSTPQVQEQFPEFSIDKFVTDTLQTQTEVVDAKLVDKNGVTRTCLNYPNENLIRCNLNFKTLLNFPEAQFVLIFHELLGLIGVEEAIPADILDYDGYKISGRLAAYVTRVGNYDLVFKRTISDYSNLKHPFCFVKKHGQEYSFQDYYKIYCGTEGEEPVFREKSGFYFPLRDPNREWWETKDYTKAEVKALTDIKLDELNMIKIPGPINNDWHYMYMNKEIEQLPTDIIFVQTNGRKAIGFDSTPISYMHVISTNKEILFELSDDLEETKLKKFLKDGRYELVISGKHVFSQYRVYVQW